MFGAIIVSDITMIADCGFRERNMLIVATSFCIGIGITEVPAFSAYMPQVVSSIFQNNMLAGVFVVVPLLPKDMDRKDAVSA